MRVEAGCSQTKFSSHTKHTQQPIPPSTTHTTQAYKPTYAYPSPHRPLKRAAQSDPASSFFPKAHASRLFLPALPPRSTRPRAPAPTNMARKEDFLLDPEGAKPKGKVSRADAVAAAAGSFLLLALAFETQWPVAWAPSRRPASLDAKLLARHCPVRSVSGSAGTGLRAAVGWLARSLARSLACVCPPLPRARLCARHSCSLPRASAPPERRFVLPQGPLASADTFTPTQKLQPSKHAASLSCPSSIRRAPPRP